MSDSDHYSSLTQILKENDNLKKTIKELKADIVYYKDKISAQVEENKMLWASVETLRTDKECQYEQMIEDAGIEKGDNEDVRIGKLRSFWKKKKSHLPATKEDFGVMLQKVSSVSEDIKFLKYDIKQMKKKNV